MDSDREERVRWAARIADVLNRYEVRATFEAVAEAIDVNPKLVRGCLPDGPQASWIVNADTGLPDARYVEDTQPRLRLTPYIIESGVELRRICSLSSAEPTDARLPLSQSE